MFNGGGNAAERRMVFFEDEEATICEVDENMTYRDATTSCVLKAGHQEGSVRFRQATFAALLPRLDFLGIRHLARFDFGLWCYWGRICNRIDRQ